MAFFAKLLFIYNLKIPKKAQYIHHVVLRITRTNLFLVIHYPINEHVPIDEQHQVKLLLQRGTGFKVGWWLTTRVC